MKFVPPDGTQLVTELGAGSIFRVALVRGRHGEVVCKRLRARMRDEPAALRALHREQHVLGCSPHAQVPRLLQRGDDAAGPFLLQTRPAGVALRVLVEAFVAREAALPGGLLLALARNAFALLAQLHRQSRVVGLVHGDMNPDHLLVTPAGEVAFIDFGQARWRDMPALLLGDERGTLPYTSPEVARGVRAPGQADDVFALAASVAFAVLGGPPCGARDATSMLVTVCERGLDTDVIARLPRLDERLRGVLLRALQHQRRGRLDDAAQGVRQLG